MIFIRQILVLLCLTALTGPLQAQEAPSDELLGSSDEVFATQGDVVLTQAELDAAFNQIPADLRLRYIRNGERVNQLVAKLLRTKLIVAEAKKAEFDKQRLVQIRMDLAAETQLAEAWVQHKIESTSATDYEVLAYEFYLANQEKYISAPTVDVSHILVSSESRGSEEALQLALQLREQVIANPENFDALVMEFSDDPSKSSNGGRFANTGKGEMVKPFEDVAFAMETPGEISEPVETAYGYHLIRLNARYPEKIMPFEEVKEQTIDGMQKKYKEEYRIRYIKSLLSEPAAVREGAVEDMLKRYYGENLELSPDIPQ
jgi:peptidyl-prolyl cis-trans isomerase C